MNLKFLNFEVILSQKFKNLSILSGNIMYTTLISTHDVAQNLEHPDWVFIDCRFVLGGADANAGRLAYEQAHLPRASYAHLDDDLSGTMIAQQTGRHPLPKLEALTQTLANWGIDGRVQVVVYDDTMGAFASRLWWLLRWLGHDHVAVMDGGWKAWVAEERPVTAEIVTPTARPFSAQQRPHLLVDASHVLSTMEDSQSKLFDSRSADRYRGENETIDPIAGHIPGATSAPFAENMGSDGKMLAQEALRERFNGLMGGVEAAKSTFYCGSGVTACHNLLALNHAGLGDAKLYSGSWSEWITDSNRPVA